MASRQEGELYGSSGVNGQDSVDERLTFVSQSVSSRPPHAHSTTVSKDGSAPLGQHKY